MQYSVAEEQQLLTDILSFKFDFPGFIYYAYPWGKENTPLVDEEGPDKWQIETATDISEHLLRQEERARRGDPRQPYQKAIASGHGIGKSTFFAWFNHWFTSTRPGAETVTTANKEQQLKNKTWPELRKWIALAINSHWFEPGAMSLKPQSWIANVVKAQLSIDEAKWKAVAETWSEDNPAGFAGLHNDIGTAILYDEASEIPKIIWETSSGALTDAKSEIVWLVFGNPTENSGPFFECFNADRLIWNPRSIDSRSVKRTNKEYLQQQVEKYGEDDDYTRVRIKGQFPRRGQNQFLSSEDIDEATEREIIPDQGAPLVMGVDVARFGSGRSVIRFRQGRDARSIKPIRIQHRRVTHVAGEVATQIDRYKPDAVFIDGGGLGSGVVDILVDRGYRVNDVNFGSIAEEQERFPDRRTEMWFRMGEWLPSGSIDQDRDLLTDLKAPFREYDGRGRIKLESKEKMERRGVDSPDDGDALALTFASRVARRDIRASRASRRLRVADGVNYSPI